MHSAPHIPYDYLVVGSGLFGAVFAREAHDNGKRVAVIEKRNHLGGSVYCSEQEGIITHEYGAHIFHTNNTEIWDYVNRFTEFEPYSHRVLSRVKGSYYGFPLNLTTLAQYWNLDSDQAVLHKLSSERAPYSHLEQAQTAESWLLFSVGADLYNHFFKGYTQKQWQRPPSELPASIVKRVPLRLHSEEPYFADRYEAMPKRGYNDLIHNLLNGIPYYTQADFFESRHFWEQQAHKIVYTGPIDQLFDYDLGVLDYRSLRFQHRVVQKPLYQPVSVVNHPNPQVPYTRVIEHKHFHSQSQNTLHSLITEEYPQDFVAGKTDPYYPIRDLKNLQLYKNYHARVDPKRYVLGGRLAEYQYYDMHQVIGSARAKAKKELSV